MATKEFNEMRDDGANCTTHLSREVCRAMGMLKRQLDQGFSVEESLDQVETSYGWFIFKQMCVEMDNRFNKKI